MRTALKSVVLATALFATPIAAFAGTDNTGFQSGREIAGFAANAQRSAAPVVQYHKGTEASGFVDGKQIAEEAHRNMNRHEPSIGFLRLGDSV